ncbi:hypothetical protein [uncultured Fusobacterium sp.]|uniref:hypothetical protein n=1 Tax=uncultured Fusobacterium sp. TaxID=159267 RepID=UPI0027DD8B0A|nr:hypothetical protein [uncultured Fusobacterium sp.]
MAQFNGMVVTNKGRELLARALASKGKFIITAAALGNGTYSGNLRECEELVNKKLDLILMGVYSEKGSTKITVGITNKNVSESFRTNEIGVYAKLEGDVESVLYAYDVAVEADTMPNNSLGTTLELVYDIYFDVSSEVEVTLEITDSIAFLTQDIAKREFLKTYIVSGGDLKGKVQLEADKQYLADDGKWYQNIGGDRVWEKSGVPDELLIEISWKTIMDEIAKKENKILVKNTAFNKNFGTAENEVLEGIQLARTLGLEYGGELNNSNTKKINTVYYDTQNKSFFKCFQENTLNYADSSYYEGISNNDLLLKLQNLFYYNRQIFNYYNMVIEIERIGKICILSISSHTPSVAQGTITGFPDWCIPKVAGCGAVCGNDPSQATGEIYMDAEGFRWFVSDISRPALYTGQIIYVAKN